MNVLTINVGSTSVKFAVFEAGQVEALREGEISWSNGHRERARLTVRTKGGLEQQSVVAISDNEAAADWAIQTAMAGDRNHAPEIHVVGHRIVHGGTEFRESVLIDAKVKRAISALGKLAPLHNPPALAVIETAEANFPGIPQVAVFDTTFYAHLEPKAFIYPLPYSYYTQWGIRRFGFHGLSHAYCAGRAAELLNRPVEQLNLVICHLGGGCSATAVRHGTAIATTLGYSPLDGLMMGTRPGSIDPGILLALQEQHGVAIEQIRRDLNSASGLLGVSGISPDLADIEPAASQGNQRAQLAFDMFADRVRAAIGGLAVTLGSLDALVFTDRMGENSAPLRARIGEGLELLGLELDSQRNEKAQPDVDIATPASRARVLVIHTREELMVARESTRVLGAKLAGGR